MSYESARKPGLPDCLHNLKCTGSNFPDIGVALLLWFYFALIYDGIVLMILFAFDDYPLEKLTLLLSSLNPIDLGRIFIMLKMDVSALMGYTGALYKDFFGSFSGVLYTVGVMFIWMVVPLLLAVKAFKRKDL